MPLSRLQVIAFLFFLFATPAFIASSNGFTSTLKTHEIVDDQLVLSLTNRQTVLVSFFDYESVEVEYLDPNDVPFEGLAIASISAKHLPRCKENALALICDHHQVSVKVDKSPFKLSFSYNNVLKTQEERGFFKTSAMRGFRFVLDQQEKLYGGGQRVVGMDRRGYRFPLYNKAHYGYGNASEQMYYSLPAVMSSKGYAVLFDNSAKGHLDIGKTDENVLQFDAVSGRTAYVITLGETLRAVSQNVVGLTGKQPLPPRWLLGSFASRFGYHTQREAESVVERFVAEDMPLDAIVLDLYWFGKDVQGHMGNLQWDRDAFPAPRDMIADFANANIHTVVITEPFILTSSLNYEPARRAGALARALNGDVKTFDFFFGNTALVDVFDRQGRDWFAEVYKRLDADGIAGFWGDLGEPEVHPYSTLHNWNGRMVGADEIHNAYGHKWAELVYDTLKTINPKRRVFSLMRSGFLGTQRYGIVPWTGDVSRSWDGLKPQVELMLQMGVFGLAYTHSDLGGFAGGDSFDSELYLRWLQLGEFQPVFRPHAQENIAPEPVFHDAFVRATARKILKQRYAMLPYNYSLVVENHLSGLPIARPIGFESDSIEDSFVSDRFMWGPSVLVAPVTEANRDSWDVELPPGKWFQRGHSQAVTGGQRVSVPIDVSFIPVFIKNGAIIPMIKPVNNTANADFSALDIHVWAAQTKQPLNNHFRYFEDNGRTVTVSEQTAKTIDFTLTSDVENLTLSMQTSGSYTGEPEAREYCWIVHGLNKPPKKIINTQSGQTVPFSWDQSSQQLSIKTPHVGSNEWIITK